MRGHKIKRAVNWYGKTDGCKTQPWCTGKITTITTTATDVVAVMTSLCHEGPSHDSTCMSV
jgi:hypothetical protein